MQNSYSKEFKESVIKKMMPPNAVSVPQLCKETGVSDVTLYKWRKEYRKRGIAVPGDDSKADDWTAEDKLAVVIETAGLNSAQLSEYCRSKGLYPEQIDQWKTAALSGYQRHARAEKEKNRYRQEDRKQIKRLESELRRKEKALAETAVLLVLSKKCEALSEQERKHILDVCNSKEFCSQTPKQIVPALADKAIYLASESSFYRILRDAGQLHHRGRTANPDTSKKPAAYIADEPNQVWSWDITYLASTLKGVFFYLYLFMDIYSRKIVGWEVYENESSEQAADVLRKTRLTEVLPIHQKVVLHSDNGSPMKGATMLATIVKTYILPLDISESELKLLAWASDGFSGADIETLCNSLKRTAVMEKDSSFSLLRALENYFLLSADTETFFARKLLMGSRDELMKALKSTGSLFSQKEIAKLFNMGESTVSRLLRQST